MWREAGDRRCSAGTLAEGGVAGRIGAARPRRGMNDDEHRYPDVSMGGVASEGEGAVATH